MESVLRSSVADGEREVTLQPHFLLTTVSQTASTRDPAEFKEILRSISEPILLLDAPINCFHKVGGKMRMETSPPALKFTYRQDSIEIVLARNTADNIRKQFLSFEEKLSLETVKPKIKEDTTSQR